MTYFPLGWIGVGVVLPLMETIYNQQSFCENGLLCEPPGHEMLMGGWDTVYIW
jgi:hypothetical protein